MKNRKTSIAIATGIALSLSSAITVEAATNPFGLTELPGGYQIAGMEGKCGGSKSGEGKCGGSKSKEGSCGGSKNSEGSCGGAKTKEAKCGEGKCGGSKPAPNSKEGKCGEGKCGGKA